ncbi:MAG TPA: carbohydrate ABC transporter permease [Prolixibacteraceae bacterium]|nr:carbohydrate ABC transporter permease [Prolixibacteraceae bacterium]
MREKSVDPIDGSFLSFLRIIRPVRRLMRGSRFESVVRFAIGFTATAIYLMPIFWMVSTSLKSPTEIFQTPPVLVPAHPQIDSYRSALGLPTNRPELYITGALYFKNSFIIAASTMLLTLVFAIPAAYALSRFNFRGKTSFMLFLIVTQMLPAVLLVIPLFVLFKMLGLYNTYFSVILADTALALPFAVIILRTSFIQIPEALEEAGLIDGASRLQVLWYIVLPLIRASLVAVGVFSFLTAWGEFVFALSFLAKPELQPISIGVFQFIGMYKTQWDTMMAFSTLVAIPAVIALLFLQRQFISGLTSGSVK